MSTRNLDYFFRPRSVALIGASASPASVGATLLANLIAAGFAGPIWPVNPKYGDLQGLPCFPDIESLPAAPDLAVIATPAATVPALIGRLGARGTRAAVVISAGFGERATTEGRALQQAILDAARPHLLRIMGPNTVGLLVPDIGLNASFAHLSPAPGEIAFATQSGALLTSVMDWAHSRGIGFSRLISLGGMADVDFGDVLDYLANDAQTRAILLYVEAVTQPRKFMSAARAAARSKPVIVCKSGRHEAGARAARSHTGALAGADAVYDSAFRRAGMLRVLTLEALFDAVESLATVRPPRGNRLAIVTNGGGVGVMATDQLMDVGGTLAELAPDTLARLDQVLPPTWSHGNPVDMVGDATPDRYAATLAAVMAAPEVDATLVLHVPVSVASPVEQAAAVRDLYLRHPQHTLLTSWIGGESVASARALLIDARVPTYDTPGDAVRAFVQLVEYQRAQQALLETPAAAIEALAPVDQAAGRRLVNRALAAGVEMLDGVDGRALLAAYGIPVLPVRACRSAAAAARAAVELGGAVALKVSSPDISHKTDVGGVVLDLEGAEAVLAAARAMRRRIRRERPDARITGFTVEPMHRSRAGHELIVGAFDDPQFGPVILFGHGGTAVEVLDDKALGLPPLNRALARDMIGRTRISRLLAGYRGLPPADLDAIAAAIVSISQLIIDLPEVIELDINPLIADASGVRALDVRVRIAPPQRPGSERLAIRPYPAELAQSVAAGPERMLLVRPVRATDGALIGVIDAEPGQFVIALRRPAALSAARLAQIDYDRDMVLLLLDPACEGSEGLLGLAVLNADPDGDRADCGLILRRSLDDRLADRLLACLIAYARDRGVEVLHAYSSADTVQIAARLRAAGFAVDLADPDASVGERLALQLRR